MLSLLVSSLKPIYDFKVWEGLDAAKAGRMMLGETNPVSSQSTVNLFEVISLYLSWKLMESVTY